MSKFVELFKKYGYSIEPFGESYIADNGVFCIPFTEVGSTDFPEISAVSFSSSDKSDIKKQYEGEKYIGRKVFSDWRNDELQFQHLGGICNYNHRLGEVEAWLSIWIQN